MEQFQILSIDKIFESPINPRRTFNEKKMAELIESIQVKGILMPLLVRPAPKDQNDGRYEIAAGHRRYRAAARLKLTQVPVIIREMTDADFLEVLTIENLQREDIEPLDEAQGYRTLMEQTKYDVSVIAAKVGKSESYIYQRIKLLELIPEAQKQLANGKITAGHAILIARLQPKEQEEALKDIYEDSWDKEVMSVRDLADYIETNIHLDLNSASFLKKDPDLIPSAGPCTTCQKRTGFAPALFPDIKKKDTCTDPDCFHAKVKAFAAKWLLEKSEDTDQPPLRLSSDYEHRMKKVPDDLLKAIPANLYHEIIDKKKDSCPSAREGIIVEGRRDEGRIKFVCIDPACKVHHNRYEDSPESQKWKTEQKARQEKEKLQETIRLRILDAILPKIKGLDMQDFNFLAMELFDELWDEHRKKLLARRDIKPVKIQYGWDQMGPMKKYIESCSMVDLGRLLMEMALIRHRNPPHWTDKRKPDSLLETAKRYKVDPKKIEAEVKAEAKEKVAAKKKRDQVIPKAKTKGDIDKALQTSAKKRASKKK